VIAMPTPWPALPLDAWRDTRETLHRYTQIVGKIQLALTPVVNHFWNVTLRVTARGLATTALRYNDRTFDIEIDLVDHRVVIRTIDGESRELELRPLAVAEFYRDVLAALATLGIQVSIWDHPVELKTKAIPFSQDREHAQYDRDAANRFFRVLTSANDVLEEFRSRFIGKCSGVGFYWGTFDLTVARYCGRRAPGPLPAGVMEREGYSHEVSEVGFWPGDAVYGAPGFFALHYPAPDGYTQARIRPSSASWQAASNCFVLPYAACREHDTRAQILEFCQSTYEAGANLARWDRADLERSTQGGSDVR
jgi:hypothetical protein